MIQSQARVLVVDDERNIRRHLGMVLATAGYQVDEASNGEEALSKCREQHYDIAFVDLQMPKMDGLELTRFLHGLSSKTAVVILTAHGSVAKAVEAMKLGAVDFLEKPFDPKIIRLLTEEILLRQHLGARDSVDDLLRLADLARKRNDYIEARAYLKTAMLHDPQRPEPYYCLGYLYEAEGNSRQAMHYYCMACDVHHTYQPARDALTRLGTTSSKTR